MEERRIAAKRVVAEIMKPTELTHKERDSAFEYACALGRLCGGWSNSDEVVLESEQTVVARSAKKGRQRNYLRDQAKGRVLAELKRQGGKVDSTAKIIGMPRSTLHTWVKAWREQGIISGIILFFCISAIAQTNPPSLMPPVNAAPIVISTNPPNTYPAHVAWDYPPVHPPITVIRCDRDPGSSLIFQQTSVTGTNIAWLSLPLGTWVVNAYGVDGSQMSTTNKIRIVPLLGIEVRLEDAARTTNRVIYSGPPMPGSNGYLRAWNTYKWAQN